MGSFIFVDTTVITHLDFFVNFFQLEINTFALRLKMPCNAFYSELTVSLLCEIIFHRSPFLQ